MASILLHLAKLLDRFVVKVLVECPSHVSPTVSVRRWWHCPPHADSIQYDNEPQGSRIRALTALTNRQAWWGEVCQILLAFDRDVEDTYRSLYIVERLSNKSVATLRELITMMFVPSTWSLIMSESIMSFIFSVLYAQWLIKGVGTHCTDGPILRTWRMARLSECRWCYRPKVIPVVQEGVEAPFVTYEPEAIEKEEKRRCRRGHRELWYAWLGSCSWRYHP